MADVDVIYGGMLKDILQNGVEINTRNSITKRVTGLSACFSSTPLVAVRKTAWKNALLEMEWFLSGSSNIKDLDPKVHAWWKPWANEDGEVCNNYSTQFRSFHGFTSEVDQIKLLVDGVANHPYSRRNVITTWNTADMVNPVTPITNCHGTVIQTFVSPNNKLDILMYQRSSDMLLGMPHNWIQYWAFLLWLAKQGGREPGKFTWIGGDCHIYQDHYALCQEIVDNMQACGYSPTMVYKGNVGDAFKASDFILEGDYIPLITKSAKMVV